MRKFFILLIAVLTLEGCANYYLSVPEPNPAGQPHKVTAIAWAWGAIDETKIASYCDITQALDNVRIRNNFGYDIVSIVTLGLVRPLDIEYHCSAGLTPVGTMEER